MENIAPLANAIGIIGVGVILMTYLLLQLGRLSADSLAYSALNLCGASFILFSLFFDWNLPSVIIESAWIIISVYGVIKAWRRRKVA